MRLYSAAKKRTENQIGGIFLQNCELLHPTVLHPKVVMVCKEGN